MLIEVDMLVYKESVKEENEEIELDIQGEEEEKKSVEPEIIKVDINPERVVMIDKREDKCLLYMQGIEPFLVDEPKNKLRKRINKGLV